MTDFSLTIVIPSVNGWTDLEPCVAAARSQAGLSSIEVLVADRVGPAVREPLRRTFPDVRVLEAEPDTAIPRLREMAFRQATGDVIGVIEDHVLLPQDWGRHMVEAHAGGAEVVGGAVENAAVDRLTDWAAFLCEYNSCLNPPPPGPADWAPGNNVTYRRAVLERFWTVIERGGWEGELHDAMKAAGIALVSRPDIRVGHKMHYSVGEYVAQRFLYSRAFAALRLDRARWNRRIMYGTAMLMFPPVLFSRIVARVWRSGRHRRELMLSLPLLIPFSVAWAAGEVVGAWFGGGDALARVR